MVEKSYSRDLKSKQRLELSVPKLLDWYSQNARDLPWRRSSNVYYIWISEIMLQQTRVEAVIPYFNRFTEVVPTVEALAKLPEQQLLKLWEGLGYYSRAKNLQKTAILIVQEYKGKMPEEYDELLKLPGIGTYTAGAIASIAFDKAVPAVDGNVLRIVSRLLAYSENIAEQRVKTKFIKDLLEIMPAKKSGEYNQAFMDLGAGICIGNGKPRCDFCPLQDICLAYQKDITDKIPLKVVKKSKKVEYKTVLLIEWNDLLVVQKRSNKGLLAGMYEFPMLENIKTETEIQEYFQMNKQSVEEIKNLGEAKHIFTHIEWKMLGYYIRLSDKPKDLLLIDIEEIQAKYPLPSAFHEYIKRLGIVSDKI